MEKLKHHTTLRINTGTPGGGENGGGGGQEDPRHPQVSRPEERQPQVGRRREELREAGPRLRGRVCEGVVGGPEGRGDAKEGRRVRRKHGRSEEREGMGLI